MSNVTGDGLPLADAGAAPAGGVAGWLDGLLDLARDRNDTVLARLVAGLMDDLAAAAAEGR